MFICLLPIIYSAENGASNIRLAIDQLLERYNTAESTQ
jgi:hypothetical protein